MIVMKFFAVFNSNAEIEFCRRSVVGTNCFWKMSVFLPNGAIMAFPVFLAFFFADGGHSYYYVPPNFSSTGGVVFFSFLFSKCMNISNILRFF